MHSKILVVNVATPVTLLNMKVSLFSFQFKERSCPGVYNFRLPNHVGRLPASVEQGNRGQKIIRGQKAESCIQSSKGFILHFKRLSLSLSPVIQC